MEIPVFQPARLKDLREAKELRVQVLAKLAKVSQPALTKAENGKAVPGSATLARIARALDAPMDYFFQPGRDPNPRRSAVEMSYRVFAEDKNFSTAELRNRCAAAVKHRAAPRTADQWRDFCELVDAVLRSEKLSVVAGKRTRE